MGERHVSHCLCVKSCLPSYLLFYRPHNGWLEMAKPFIAAYKAGAKSVNQHIEKDQLIYWYRPSLKSANCDATDNTMKAVSNPSENFFQGRPNGADTLSDSVFVVALLKEPGTVKVASGSNSKTFTAQAGANAYTVNMGAGKQQFSLTRGGNAVLSGTSPRDISADCICGIYNFNAYVGTLPAGQPDALRSPEGFQCFKSGLPPGACQPTPLLGPAASAGPEPTGVVTLSQNSTSSGSSGSSSSDVITIAPVETPTPQPPVTSTEPSSSSTSTTQSSASTSTTQSSAPMSTSAPTTTSPTSQGGSGSGSGTITALSQLYPTNCLQKGQVWAGPPGSDPAARCDGA